MKGLKFIDDNKQDIEIIKNIKQIGIKNLPVYIINAHSSNDPKIEFKKNPSNPKSKNTTAKMPLDSEYDMNRVK